MINSQTDSRAHVMLAEQMSGGHIATPHLLFQALVVGVFRSGLVRSFQVSGLVVLLPFYALTAFVIYGLLHSVFHDRPRFIRTLVLSFVVAATVLVEPLTWPSKYSIGYFWPTTYDNPTSTLTKPLSLISFVFSAWFLANRGARSKWACGLFAVATVAAALSKPSFIICLVPAVGLMLFVRLIQRKTTSIGSLSVGLFVPAAVVLGWSYLETYSGTTGSVDYRDSIIWAPWMVMRHYSSHLALKFLLSVAFPLMVLGLHWNRARRDVTLMLAWLSFLFASFYGYMLAEKVRFAAGNFLWSGYIAVFVLFVASVMFWLRELSKPPKNNWFWGRSCLCGVILALHSISGVLVTWRYLKLPR